MNLKPLVLLLLLASVGCGTARQDVDMLLVNANVYTVDESFSKAEAFAVHEGKFVGVGTTEEMLDAYTSGHILDADGRTIVPGLIDAHCHFYGLGLDQRVVNLTGTQSFAEVIERVHKFQAENDMTFIQGRGWDQNDWESKELPTKKELDSLFPDTPVALRRIDGHALLVNQAALDRAGIDLRTNTDGGEIIRVRHRGAMALTGVLVDRPMRWIDSITPSPDLEARVQALKAAERICVDYGLTTVNDAGLDRSVIELIDSLQKRGELRIRVYAMVANTPANLDHFLSQGTVKTDRLNVRSVKVYGDGALGSRGAALKRPYSDRTDHFGAMITPAEAMESLAMRIARSDYQMNTHAIGDSANAVVLRAYTKALQGTRGRRWKIEHAQVVDTVDFETFGNIGIIPSVQPTHATSDMYWAGDRLGEQRLQGAYAFKTLLEDAGRLALGTDFPVEDVNPFMTFYAAVARRDRSGYPEGGYRPTEVLSREEALRGMTIWAAYSNFEETEKGSIETGKKADFVILSGDIMEIPMQEVPELQAEQVFIDGMVFE